MMSGSGKNSTFIPFLDRDRLIASVLCLAAAASAWGNASLLIRAPLGFALMGLIPGWLLARILLRYETVTTEELGMAATVLSIPLTILARIIATSLGVSGAAFVVVWALVCTLGVILFPKPADRRYSSDPVAWLIAIGLGMAVVFPAIVSPNVFSWGDASFHAQVVHEILPRTFPAEHPAYYGMPLVYAWIFHIFAAALVEAMGVTSYAAFWCINGVMMAALVLGVYRLASLYWPSLLHRRLAPPILALGMNAIGWLTYIAVSVATSFVGEVRGVAELKEAFAVVLGNPSADSVNAALIYKTYFVLSSFLYKYMCLNVLAPCLTLIVAAFVLASRILNEGGWGRFVAFGLVVGTATIVHPLVGVPAAGGLFVGFLVACLNRSIRLRSLTGAAIVMLALILAAPLISFMSGVGLSTGDKARLNPATTNFLGLFQALFVVAVPSLWGWWKLRQREPILASFGAGFGLAMLAAAVVIDFPRQGETYLVYVAYLGVAFFASGGIAAAVSSFRRRGRGVLAWVLLGFLFLPTTILLIQGFARDDRGPGSHGYPETHDEIAVFDYLRDQTPGDAVVVDSQVSHLPPCAAYSHRRAFHGGVFWAELVNFPEEEMKRRERAVINLFFEPGVSDSTWSILAAVKRPVYIVARNYFPHMPSLRGIPDEPISDAIDKLESYSEIIEPVFRTPTIVVFRFRGER